MRLYLTLLKQLLGRRRWVDERLGLNLGGFGIDVPLGCATRLPTVLRHGRNPGDPSPLYQMDVARLRQWFPAYLQTPELRQDVLYSETVRLCAGEMRPFRLGGPNVVDLKIDHHRPAV